MIPLEEGEFYHIYNRANGYDKVFINKGNYQFFILRYKKYLFDYLDLYCYCLMPNHFHLLVRVKKIKELKQQHSDLQSFGNLEGLNAAEAQTAHANFLSNQFSKFFNSYAKALNKQQKRKGSVFMKNFKRKKVNDEIYLKKLIHYIHNNPVEARLCSKPGQWQHSSYESILKNENEFLKTDEIINWFVNKENFEKFHFLNFEFEEAE